MPDILPGFRFETASGRYKSNATNRYVARRAILGLLNDNITATEAHFTEITTAVVEGRMAPALWQEQVRSEMRRQVLAQEALGAGGWDRLGPRQFGRAGGDLRTLYGKISGTAADMTAGKVTLPQALARVNEYAGAARSHFYEAERETIQRSASNVVIIERRLLGAAAKHCQSCLDYYSRGWELLGSLPVPGTDSECRNACKCRLERQEVPAVEVNDWLGSKR